MYSRIYDALMNTEKSNKRGGARKGAGRPKGRRKIISFRANQEVVDYMEEMENKSDFIQNCIIKEMQTNQKPDLSEMGKVVQASQVKPLTLPFFDVKIVAGFPIPLNNDELSQDIELLQMLCPHPDSSYLIRVLGDSMIDAGVNDGDILIVDKSNRNPSDKEIAVCELNGEYTVKRVERAEGKCWLVPANPNYPKIEVSDGDRFNVWGIVTYIIHKPK